MKLLCLLLATVPLTGAWDQACLEAGTCEENKSAPAETETIKTPTCSLYLAQSNYEGLGVYSGTNFEKGDILGEPDILIPVIDANKREWSLWHTVAWNPELFDDISLENQFSADLIAPGIGSHARCRKEFHSAAIADPGVHDSAGVHRTSDVTAGSFSYRYNYTIVATRPIQAGEEIFFVCGGENDATKPPKPATPEWLEEEALCMDGLRPGISTLPGAGRGAFSKRVFRKGDVVTHSPVLVMGRRETYISEQHYDDEEEKIVFSSEKKGTQLMLNYCFGDRDSNMLLLPTGPIVNFINHNGEAPNVAIRWSSSALQPSELFKSTASQVLESRKPLIIEYVALTEIKPGDEVFLDYGKDWWDAWSNHTESWQPSDEDADYVYPAEFNALNLGKDVRTLEEQQAEPYPYNLQTTCRFMQTDEDIVDSNGNVLWTDVNDGCPRPCNIVSKETSSDPSKGTLYTAVVEHDSLDGTSVPISCSLYEGDFTVKNIPRDKIFWTDKVYNSDLHLRTSFRHEIGVPDDFFPPEWRVDFHESKATILRSPIKPLEISPMVLEGGDGDPIAYGFRIGLPAEVSDGLRAYCDRTGITQLFRSLVVNENPLEPSEDRDVVLNTQNWYVQRPAKKWKSNMHWISPNDEVSQFGYLQALGASGFDKVLERIGEYFGFDGLVCYHLTFVGVSYSQKSYIHYDFENTDRKAFNVIIPLYLASETGPELDIQSDDESIEAGYRYEHNVASMVGDSTMHGTAAVDYRDSGEMRMAATVYIADVNPGNVERILQDYTQSYPPRDVGLLLSNAGSHWRAGDNSKRLPQPGDPVPDEADDSPKVSTSELRPLEIVPMLPGRVQYGFRMKVPDQVTSGLRAYCDRIGITEKFHSLVLGGKALEPGTDDYVKLGGNEWYVQRPDNWWKSNMHWISPGGAGAQDSYLEALGESGFDEVLKAMGEHLGLDGLVCYHLTFIGVSYSQKSYIHHDFLEVDGKAYNVIIPLLLANETPPELDVRTDDESTIVGYRYRYGEASLIGDKAYHGTAAVDYRDAGEMRMAATVYIADVNPGNVEDVLKDYTQNYPPNNADMLLSNAGSHWKADDNSKCLPQPSLVNAATPELSPLDIVPILPGRVQYGFRMKLPDQVTSGLRAYCDRVGITEKFHSLVLGGKALEPGTDEYANLEGNEWYVQRPDNWWKSNMHWISPGGAGAQDSYLEALGESGFDEVLKAMGEHLGLDGLVCYHLTFIGVSYSQKSYIHYDFSEVDGKAYNVIIPLLLANETPPELDIQTDDGSTIVGYRYRYGEASLIGDGANHGTAAVDYLEAGEMRMAATVYIADVNPGNVDHILDEYTQKYPPNDADMLLSNAGSHWQANDPSKRLPQPKGEDEL